MLVTYKRNKKLCYQSTSGVPALSAKEMKSSKPFESCGSCPYSSHGFMCYSTEGDCMKTMLKKGC